MVGSPIDVLFNYQNELNYCSFLLFHGVHFALKKEDTNRKSFFLIQTVLLTFHMYTFSNIKISIA